MFSPLYPKKVSQNSAVKLPPFRRQRAPSRKRILIISLTFASMTDVILKKGKEKAAVMHHPWIFSGAVDRIKGKPENGEVVAVRSADKEFLAYAYYNDQSRVALRLLEWDESVVIDKNWYSEKLKNAISARRHVLSEATNTCRLVFSEADFLPGLIVDKYAEFLSLQILSSGIEAVKNDLIDILVNELNPKGIFDKSDAGARKHENLADGQGLLWGEHPPEFIEVRENGVIYHINISEGQKSGFYCDQRDNRQILAAYTKGKTVLDCFCYSGGFSLNSLKQGASHVTSIDSSALAIETLQHNVALNGLKEHSQTSVQSDVNKQLRAFKEEGRKFEVIILDPPKYAPSRSALDRAARAYKDLNRLGMLLLEKGGILATFSCSGAVDLETFKQIIAWAALDAGREVQIIKQFSQPEDHPVRISFPEGEYLKGLLLRVL